MADVETVDATASGLVLDLFATICDATTDVLARNDDWGWSGRRDTQYAVDLAMDDACVPPLHMAGYAVLSEESGVTLPPGVASVGDAAGVVVVDPLDGSTNAGLHVPWCATSLCLVAGGEPTVAMVANLRTGDRYHAVAGAGAHLNGRRITVGEECSLREAVVAVNGRPGDGFRPRQYRAMGATALDIAAVGRGDSFDGYLDADHDAVAVWDYLGALLVVREAGGLIVDADGRELVTLDPAERRRPVAATSPGLLDELLLVS